MTISLALPGHFKSGLATSICPPTDVTDVVRGGDGRSRRHRKRSRLLAGAVSGGARAQEAAELGTAVPARSAGPERAQEPAADGDQPGVVGGLSRDWGDYAAFANVGCEWDIGSNSWP